MSEYKEYDTVMIPVSGGKEKEFAIMDEFDLEEKHYIVVSLIQEDMIQEGLYIYRAKEMEGELLVERIENVEELEKVSAYYLQK